MEKVAFACDHRGYDVKKNILDFLKHKNFEVVDFGTNSADSVDYPDYILKAAESVSQGKCAKAIGVCYTGIGSAIAANKVPGQRLLIACDIPTFSNGSFFMGRHINFLKGCVTIESGT